MSYCVNCGVELAEGEKRCPLCFTEVYNPKEQADAVRPYPAAKEVPKPVNIGALVTLISLILSGLILISVACDLFDSGSLTWSAYVMASLLLVWVFVVPPIAIRRNRVFASLLLDFIGISLFLYAIQWLTAGNWFFTFAFPLVLALLVLTVCGVALPRILHFGKMSLGGLLLIETGLCAMCVDFLVKWAFQGALGVSWSFFVLIPCGILGILAIIIDKNAKIREEFIRRFYI